MTFQEKLYQLRRERGYSQEQLARELGVSRQAISRWELQGGWYRGKPGCGRHGIQDRARGDRYHGGAGCFRSTGSRCGKAGAPAGYPAGEHGDPRTNCFPRRLCRPARVAADRRSRLAVCTPSLGDHCSGWPCLVELQVVLPRQGPSCPAALGCATGGPWGTCSLSPHRYPRQSGDTHRPGIGSSGDRGLDPNSVSGSLSGGAAGPAEGELNVSRFQLQASIISRHRGHCKPKRIAGLGGAEGVLRRQQRKAENCMTFASRYLSL